MCTYRGLGFAGRWMLVQGALWERNHLHRSWCQWNQGDTSLWSCSRSWLRSIWGISDIPPSSPVLCAWGRDRPVLLRSQGSERLGVLHHHLNSSRGQWPILTDISKTVFTFACLVHWRWLLNLTVKRGLLWFFCFFFLFLVHVKVLES